jgi:hypothetical protein
VWTKPVGDGEYTVRQGESIESIADERGFFVDTLWNDSANAAVKEARKNPNLILPGDKIHIREKRKKQIDKPDAAKHTFRRKGVPSMFRIVLQDNGEPRSGVAYKLEIDSVVVKSGTTGSDGLIESPVSARARSGRLLIDGDEEKTMDLVFRELDPANSPSGVAARLVNLGFLDSAGASQVDPETLASSLMKFQEAQGLDPTGELDQQTLDKLVDEHKC